MTFLLGSRKGQQVSVDQWQIGNTGHEADLKSAIVPVVPRLSKHIRLWPEASIELRQKARVIATSE